MSGENPTGELKVHTALLLRNVTKGGNAVVFAFCRAFWAIVHMSFRLILDLLGGFITE